MKKTILIVLAFAIPMITTIVISYAQSDGVPSNPSAQTKKLCRWYADKDHEMELAPDRWQWFLDRGINPNEDFDWYQSCIDHNTTPIAR